MFIYAKTHCAIFIWQNIQYMSKLQDNQMEKGCLSGKRFLHIQIYVYEDMTVRGDYVGQMGELPDVQGAKRGLPTDLNCSVS